MLLNKRRHQSEKPSNHNEDPEKPKLNQVTSFKAAPHSAENPQGSLPRLALYQSPAALSLPSSLPCQSFIPHLLPATRRLVTEGPPCTLSLCLVDTEVLHLSLPCPPYLSNPPWHHITLLSELPLQQFYFCFNYLLCACVCRTMQDVGS